MLPYKIFQVFSNEELGYKGNTAAVVLLENPMSAELMQSIASNLNQPATAFLWRFGSNWHIRWFAPDEEIILCGHGAFAAFAFLHEEGRMGKSLDLSYTEGIVNGHDRPDGLEMHLDAIPTKQKIDPPKEIIDGLGIPILEMYETSNKYLIVTDTEAHLREMQPDFSKLRESEIFGYAVTAPGEDADFVSRTLVPHVGQLEDHATGSSHAILTPFWGDRLKKRTMIAQQLSPRGGYFVCELYANQVNLTGEYKLIAKGDLMISDY